MPMIPLDFSPIDNNKEEILIPTDPSPKKSEERRPVTPMSSLSKGTTPMNTVYAD